VIALAAAALAACEQNRGVTDPAAAAVETSLQARHAEELGDGRDGARAVYTLTNQVAGNSVAVFTRAADGTLSAAGRVATGGDGNISGFTVSASGDLTPISDAIRPLSGTNVGPAQVSFSPDGRRLVVTEKTTNLLDVYVVGENGAAGARTSAASAGVTPFG